MDKIIYFPKIVNPLEEDVVSIDDIRKRMVLKEVEEILDSLREDYELDVSATMVQIQIIMDRFYEYYQKKEIVSSFPEYMIGHFNDMAIDAIEEEASFTIDYVLNKLYFYELIDSRIEVNPEDTKKMIKQLKERFGEHTNEG